MDSEDANNILGQLFSGGTALAGLVLVFLGSVLASYDSFEPTAKRAVRRKYRWRAWVGFAGFLCSLVAATAGLIGLMRGAAPWLWVGVAALVLSGLLLVALALVSVVEIG